MKQTAALAADVTGLPAIVSFLNDLVRYGGVSAAALACDAGLLVVLASAGLPYLAASAIGFCIGMAVAYGLSARFVFADRRGPRGREATGFVAVGLAGLLLTQALLFALVSGFSVAPALAKIPTAACVFLFNFLARRALVFREATRRA